MKNEWISVDDRLPAVDMEYSMLSGGERSAPVLVHDGFALKHARDCREPERDSIAIGYYFHTVKDWRTTMQPNGKAEITHWMPPPDPPSEIISKPGAAIETRVIKMSPVARKGISDGLKHGKSAANLPANLSQVEIASRTIDDPKGVKEV